MNTRIMGYMTLVVLAGMALILLLNFSQLFTPPKNERYLSYNGVRGIAVEHKKQLWTLNFEQQNGVIEHINRSLPIGKGSQRIETKPLDFARLVIYRFKGPDLSLKSVGQDGENLVFESPELNADGYLLDVSGGTFKALLQESYDP